LFIKNISLFPISIFIRRYIMKMLTLFFSLFAWNAFADVFICNTPGLGAGYRIVIRTNFNTPVARYDVIRWSSAPPPAFGEKVLIQNAPANIEIQQRIPRDRIKTHHEDYTKWIFTSADLDLNINHYGVANAFGKIGKFGSGLPGDFDLKKLKVKGRVDCMRKK